MHENSLEPAFRSDIKATGYGECWSHTNENFKFKQYGWRCREGRFNPSVMVGNWNEQQFDNRVKSQLKPLPSQFSHHFVTSHSVEYVNRKPKNPVSEVIELKKQRNANIPCAYPCHQPVAPHTSSYQTTSRRDYTSPVVVVATSN